MNQPFRMALSIFTAVWLSGCEVVATGVLVLGAEQAAWNYLLSGPGQPSIAETEINADELKSVKTIALLEIPDTSGYGDFGLEFGEFSFRSTTQKFLKRHLEESGFKVIDLPANRKNSLHLKDNYLGLDSEVADAYLDVAPVRIAYTTTGLSKYSDDGFGPHVTVTLRLVSAKSKKVVYSGTVQYGWAKNPSLSGIKIDSPGGHRFERFEAIEEQKEEAIHHFEYGIELISLSIVNKIKSGKSPSLATKEIDTVTVTDPYTGTYVSEITGKKDLLDVKGNSLMVQMVKNGNKVKGTFGSFGGEFEGTVDGSIITFDWYSSWTHGKGKWEIKSGSSDLIGTWRTTGGYEGTGRWNLKRVE